MKKHAFTQTQLQAQEVIAEKVAALHVTVSKAKQELLQFQNICPHIDHYREERQGFEQFPYIQCVCASCGKAWRESIDEEEEQS